jgi:PAS domain-containing protein
MATPERQTTEKNEQQLNDLFDALELTQAVDTEEFRILLDHVPIAIVVSKLVRGDQRIVYANTGYESLTGQLCADMGWSVLAAFRLEDEPHLAFEEALATCDDFVGTFKREPPTDARGSLFRAHRE